MNYKQLISDKNTLKLNVFLNGCQLLFCNLTPNLNKKKNNKTKMRRKNSKYIIYDEIKSSRTKFTPHSHSQAKSKISNDFPFTIMEK